MIKESTKILAGAALYCRLCPILSLIIAPIGITIFLVVALVETVGELVGAIEQVGARRIPKKDITESEHDIWTTH